MAIYYNGVEVKAVNYNGQPVQTINHNGQDFSLAPPAPRAIWSGKIENLPIFKIEPTGSVVVHATFEPDPNDPALLIVSSLTGANVPCILGGGLYYDDNTKSITSLDPNPDSSKEKMRLGDFEGYRVISRIMFTPVSNLYKLEVNLGYYKGTADCSWGSGLVEWYISDSVNTLNFNGDDLEFSGSTNSYGSLGLAGETILWEATADGTGISAAVAGTSYGTINLTME